MEKKRKKKNSLAWRATKATFRGLGRGSWWLVRNVSKGIYRGGKVITTKIKEKKQQKRLQTQPHYQTPATFAPLPVAKAVSGEKIGTTIS